VDAGTAREEQEDVVAAGSTLLLYTDGLVERRGQVFDEGVDLLGRALRDLRALPVGEMCDALLARLLPAPAMDDVALVPVRLGAQER
jgi:two-component system, chemotaxis family, sensor kinase Cph1